MPIAADKCDEFDPLTSPTITDLLNELAEYARKSCDKMQVEGAKPLHDWQKTSLEPYVNMLKDYVKGLDEETRAALANKRAENQHSLDF